MNLPLASLDAAKNGIEISCPVSELGLEGLDQVSFSLPVYQRGLVWTEKHGRKFQQSLALGWPIGEIVLAEREATPLPNNSGQLRRYDLIDGQQRTHWLNRTRDRFFADGLYSFETPGTVSALAALANDLGLNGASEVQETYRIWTSESGFLPSRELEDLNKFLHFLTSRHSVSPPAFGTEAETRVQSAIIALNGEIKAQYAALKELKIPTLVIRHSLHDNLHEIFQELNSGTKLSDLDLLAAEWSTIPAPIGASTTLSASDRDEVVQFAKNRIADSYEDDEYTYNPDLSELQASELSLFDTLYGLGKFAHARYPVTFAAMSESCDRLALFVAAILFTGGVNSRKQLATQYPDEPASSSRDVSNFPQHFLQACKEIDSAFNPLNAVRAGKKLKGRLGLVQAAAYIATYIANVYWVAPATSNRMESRARNQTNVERNGPDGTAWSVAKRVDNFKGALIGWFLRDVLREEFQGSDAYSNAAARVWSVFDRENATFTPNPAMLGQAAADELSSLLQDQFGQEFEVSATPKQRRYSESACAVLRVAYSKAPPHINDEEIDHVLPFDLRRNRNFPVAINHPGNLMPLRKRINGKRGDRTLDVFVADPNVDSGDKSEATERLLTDPADCGPTALANRDAYRTFLESRYRKLCAFALEATGIEDFATSALAQQEVATWFPSD